MLHRIQLGTVLVQLIEGRRMVAKEEQREYNSSNDGIEVVDPPPSLCGVQTKFPP